MSLLPFHYVSDSTNITNVEFTFITAEGASNPNTYRLVCLSSNGHGAFYLSAIINHSAYYVTIDSHNKVKVLSTPDIANVSS